MADHWVAEVFPPKFQFESVDELLKCPEEDEESKEKVKHLNEVYRKVYLEEKSKKSTDEELKVKSLERLEKKQRVPKERKQKSKAEDKDKDECIWNHSELQMLRKFLQKAKMQNLKLAAMLESAQGEIDTWKEKFKDVAESDEHVNNNFRILKKKYERLKVNYRALKEDVRRYHANLKISREECRQLNLERDDLQKSLSQTQAELNVEKLNCEHLQLRLNKKGKEYEESLKNHEHFMEQQHLLELAKLQKEVLRLTEEFEKEKRDNDLNKKALEHLRGHFANLKINQEFKDGANVVDSVLSVIDIDYLPT